MTTRRVYLWHPIAGETPTLRLPGLALAYTDTADGLGLAYGTDDEPVTPISLEDAAEFLNTTVGDLREEASRFCVDLADDGTGVEA